jgi:hypothetical protein
MAGTNRAAPNVNLSAGWLPGWLPPLIFIDNQAINFWIFCKLSGFESNSYGCRVLKIYYKQTGNLVNLIRTQPTVHHPQHEPDIQNISQILSLQPDCKGKIIY